MPRPGPAGAVARHSRAAGRAAGSGGHHGRSAGPGRGAGVAGRRWRAAAGDRDPAAGADGPHAGGPDRGRRPAPAADRPAVPHRGDRRVQPLCGRHGRDLGGTVGAVGRVVPDARGARQAGLAGAARRAGGVADERQAAGDLRRQRGRVPGRGAAPRLRAARHQGEVAAAGPAALRRDPRAGHRHNDAAGARVAGHHVLQPAPARRVRLRRQGGAHRRGAGAVAGPGGGLLSRPGALHARADPGRGLGRRRRTCC